MHIKEPEVAGLAGSEFCTAIKALSTTKASFYRAKETVTRTIGSLSSVIYCYESFVF